MHRIFAIEQKEPSQASASFHGKLKADGFELEYGEAGDGAVESILSGQHDLVLVDAGLPEAEIMAFCQALKGRQETETIPVIFVHSAGEKNGVLVKSFESGANDYITLGEQDSSEIMARLQAAMRTRQMNSHSVALAQQLTEMNTELYERNLAVEKELYVTRQLQQSLLPPFLPDDEVKAKDPDALDRISKCHYRDERLRITGIYLPCDALGGDIYDIIKFHDGSVGVTVADVSGHGVPAGFITAIYKSLLYRATHSYSSPKDILFHLNNELADIIRTGEYVTSVYCRLQAPDLFSKGPLQLEFSGAGHPYPLHHQASSGKVAKMKENGTPLVWVKNMEYPMGMLQLERGDSVLLYTDGVTEMRNPEKELYGEDRLESAFSMLAKTHPSNILDQMIVTLSDFTQGHPLEDDVSMVLIEAL